MHLSDWKLVSVWLWIMGIEGLPMRAQKMIKNMIDPKSIQDQAWIILGGGAQGWSIVLRSKNP